MVGIIFGFIFLALGLITLLKSAGIIVINLDFGLIFWSLFFLFIGLKLIIKSKKNRFHFWGGNNSGSCDCKDPSCDCGCDKSDNQKF